MTEFATQHSDPSDRVSFPPLNFRAARRRLVLALTASVVVPLSLSALYAYYTYERAVAEQSEILNRLAWVAEGKLTNLLDSNRDLISRVQDVVGTADEWQILREQASLHRKLEALVANHPQVVALSIVDKNGQLIVSSRFSPTPDVSIGDRGDFMATRAASSQLYVSLPERGRVQGTDIVNTLAARTAPDGRFLGAIVVSLHRSYLLQFYQRLIAETPALTVGLYRADGGILLRLPAPRLANPPPKHEPLAAAFARGAEQGIIKIDSPLDGTRKMLAYRRAGQYPVYVSAGYAIDDVVSNWLRDDMSLVAVALIPCMCLCVLIVFSLRRLRAEETSWQNWRRELSRRRSAEAATRKMQRMGALGNLVASVAHDFNNLLMVVTANMEIVRRKNYNGVKNEIDAVERASTSARALARRLMSVARRQPLQMQTLLPGAWLLETEALIRSAVSSKVAVQIEVAEASWPIKVDPSEITSAIINIAVNAKDAMPQGGTFVVRCRNVALSQGRYELEAGEYVEFSCQDSGTGMTREVAQHAFEPLFTTKQAGAGTGLGLAQVLAMAEQAGGKARVETDVGRGTTIFFYLPHWTAGVTEASPAEREGAIEPGGAKSTILLVEDNEEVAAGLVAVLDVLGWSARHEPSGDAALKVLEEGLEFDLVLSDIQMPGTCDGIGLVEWIKRQRPKQAVTLMTGYAEHLEQARRLGVAVLSKPFNADDLDMLLKGVALSSRHA
jgi:signal transduction histidine kinase